MMPVFWSYGGVLSPVGYDTVDIRHASSSILATVCLPFAVTLVGKFSVFSLLRIVR